MREDNMPDSVQNRRVDLRAPGPQRIGLLINHKEALGNMPYQLARIGVRECHIVCKLFGFADVVEKNPGQNQIGLHIRIQR